MDLDAPQLFTALFVGSVGFGLFVYGRKQRRGPQLLAGFLLMLLPILVRNAWFALGGSAAVVAGLWAAVGAGF